jgi:hypothetical protein
MEYPSYDNFYQEAYDRIMLAKATIANEVEYYENWGGIADVVGPIINGDNNSLERIKNAGIYVENAEKKANTQNTVDDIIYYTVSTLTITAAIKGGKVISGMSSARGTSLKFSQSSARHMQEAGRYVPIQILQQAIKDGNVSKDPQGSSALMYTIEMFKNNVSYTLEVLYDSASNMIYHFKYWR